ncbi:MAG: hypothetical protein RLZ98_329 [Pseudomonadota bacterium]|jgi:MFS family permease
MSDTAGTSSQRTVEQDPHVPISLQVTVYAIGSFSNSANLMAGVLLPLWAVAIGASPFVIGVIVGARYFLTSLLSIHGGAMMDRLGTRRILVVSGAIAALTTVLFPVLPFVAAAIVLQMLSGLAANYGTIGAQSIFGNLMRGRPKYAGRFAFGLRVGQLIGPPLAGIAWDLGGHWAGFALLTAWGVGLFVASLLLPADVDGATPSKTPPRIEAHQMMPRLGDYLETFRMMAAPAVLLVVIMTFLRMAGQGMQSSFFVVYLEQLDYTGTVIGLLVGASSLVGFAGALSITNLTRVMAAEWLLIISVAISIVFVAVTPLIAASGLLLLLASAARGAAMGLSQPLMMTILAAAAGSGRQGKAVGLRTTANRVGSMIVPILMGAVAEVAGIEASFYIIGGVLLALMFVSIRPARQSIDQAR